MVKILKNGDLELRNFFVSDADKLFNLVDKNRDYLEEWLPWLQSVKKAEDSEKKIKEWAEKEKKGEGVNLGIWYKRQLVGVVSFNFINKENKKAEIGYWLDKNHQGKGIMTKSCELLIDYGFNELKLHRIEISCAQGNNKSCAIAERLGFTKEGYFRESALLNGEFVNMNWYGFLKSDWENSKSS
ncbi:MAG: RimJ/RimL family protein N-acetyltransferase [Candidatus Levybacteria bacterium CG10_big_fil_rev_8_21_14_0_10_35_13]|nr:MAG: RimJ/RimL family protein N-acetyltransferase [Candidatus Levybacteria bacterium CG10_big_fil_rev_8_21_14_0_10_35_13]